MVWFQAFQNPPPPVQETLTEKQAGPLGAGRRTQDTAGPRAGPSKETVTQAAGDRCSQRQTGFPLSRRCCQIRGAPTLPQF